jgi:hypothetical protein
MRRPALVLAVLCLALVLAAVPAQAGARGQFVLRCLYSHSLMDDPIVAPGQPGASHLHDFFGNTTTDAFSTVDSLLAGGTTCRVPSDTAAYWTPTAYLNGTSITPIVMRIYYLAPKESVVETIPPGLQMIGGNKAATSAAYNPHVRWYCGETKEVKTPRQPIPYDCTPWSTYPFVDGVVGIVDLPNCWNGSGLTPEDVVYPVSGHCPIAFRHVLPIISERVHFGVMNPLNADGSVALSLSSGAYFTLHGDFWNTWQQARLDQLVQDCVIAGVHCGSVDATDRIDWVRQFGTSRYDLAYAAASDGDGGTYVAGFTDLALPGQTYHHRSDAFLRRYDASGTELWTRQFGTNGTDQALALSVEGSSVYVSGSTDGRFPDQHPAGGLDAFVGRFDADGAQLWLRQFGTGGDDSAAAITATASAVYVAGSTAGRFPDQERGGPSDAFVTRLDSDGNEVWTRQLGGGGADLASAISAGAGTVFVGGSADGGLDRHAGGDADAFVTALRADGTTSWVHGLGSASSADAVTGLISRTDGVFVSGWTDGALPGQTATGGTDAFVAELGDDGAEAWIRQFGTAFDDDAAGLAATGHGLYVAGSTAGDLVEGGSLGELDAFVRKYLPNGTEVWTNQLGTNDYDRLYGVSADPAGLSLVGTTHGAFEGSVNAGDRDVFVARVAFS